MWWRTTVFPQLLLFACCLLTLLTHASEQRKGVRKTTTTAGLPAQSLRYPIKVDGCDVPSINKVNTGNDDFDPCCDILTACYQTCNSSKSFCDAQLSTCLNNLCQRSYESTEHCTHAKNKFLKITDRVDRTYRYEKFQRSHCDVLPSSSSSTAKTTPTDELASTVSAISLVVNRTLKWAERFYTTRVATTAVYENHREAKMSELREALARWKSSLVHENEGAAEASSRQDKEGGETSQQDRKEGAAATNFTATAIKEPWELIYDILRAHVKAIRKVDAHKYGRSVKFTQDMGDEL